MAQALKKLKIERDRFTPDGVRLFNQTREHGVVYCDGYMEVKYIQEYEGREMHYRGDGAPVGYKEGVPLPKHADELLTENEQLQARIRDLEDSQKKTNELLERLSAQLGAKAPTAETIPPNPDTKVAVRETAAAPEAPARGVQKPK
jgi:hypothetical protein